MFWQNRNVFLTGHTGFKGAWLSLWLEQLGAAVTGFALAPHTQPSLFASASLDSGIASLAGDIGNLADLREAMVCAQPELIIHLAAQSLARPSYVEPVSTFATNVMGAVHVLEAARSCPSVRAIVIVTSDKCYENQHWSWAYRESDPLGGDDPYSSSKACAELVTACYRSSFFDRQRFSEHGVAIATARAGNVVGGGDWAPGRLVPDAVRALSAGAPLRIRNPHITRPWQHVLEPLSGYLALAQALLEEGVRADGAWNFGPAGDSVQTVEAVIRRFTTTWNNNARRPAKWDVEPGPHPLEPRPMSLDCSRAKDDLSWRPALSFAETIDLTAEWYSRHLAGENARDLCLEQLAYYTELSTHQPLREVQTAPPQAARLSPRLVPGAAMRA